MLLLFVCRVAPIDNAMSLVLMYRTYPGAPGMRSSDAFGNDEAEEWWCRRRSGWQNPHRQYAKNMDIDMRAVALSWSLA
jgi:hypothetical protein